MKVVLCGPSHSGKSCLRFGLKEAIKTIPGAPYPYVIMACPDGEGSWFHETASENLALATTLKAACKGEFTEERAQIIAEWIKNCSIPLTLIDIGGIPDAKNEQICASASHAVLLAGDRDRLVEWRAFCNKLGLQIVAELYSDYSGVSDGSLMLSCDEVYRGSIHHLERGDLSVQHRPTVIQLANLLVRMATAEEG